MLPRRSILLKLVLLISVVLTAIFVCTGYFLEQSIAAQANRTVEEEVLSSFGLTSRSGTNTQTISPR